MGFFVYKYITQVSYKLYYNMFSTLGKINYTGFVLYIFFNCEHVNCEAFFLI